ncbi:unnamed protein product [Lactuca virosa]|uniref:Uncharacterized protein n=1 Tax=Lactuca virosa TaxID=75947 RepID=A0AAU9PHR8_9ASTR|nr:unnamed protein product [Lactuca virosa]
MFSPPHSPSLQTPIASPSTSHPSLSTPMSTDSPLSVAQSPPSENTISVHDDNLQVVDLEALTPSSSAGKRPIEIVATTDSLEWFSSKGGVVSATLKIPKMKNLE